MFVVGTVGLVSKVSKLTSKLYKMTVLFCNLIFFVVNRCVCTLLTFTALKILIPFFCCGMFKSPTGGGGVFVNSANDLAVNVVAYVLDLGLLSKFPMGRSVRRPGTFFLTCSPLVVPYFSIMQICLRHIQGKGGPFLPSGGRVRRGVLTINVERHAIVVTVMLMSIYFALYGVLLSHCVGMALLLVLSVFV